MKVFIYLFIPFLDEALSADSDDESLSSSSEGSSSSASSSSSSSEDEDEGEGERAGVDSMDESTMDSTIEKDDRYDSTPTLRAKEESPSE